ncbi:MAG: zinc-ribbon domain-containing protein [Atopobiaceae bacterium]|nr:zinc-ribbon domain-containing protein [Atopobiaceae bacterium]
MFCPNCGTEAMPGQKFCMNCGQKLILDVPAEPDAAEPAEPVSVEVPEPVEVEVAEPVEEAIEPEVVEAVEPQATEAVEPTEAVESEPVEVVEAIPEPMEAAEAIPEPVETTETIPAPAAPEPEAVAIPEPVEAAESIPSSAIEAAETALFEVAEAVKREVRGEPEGSGVVVERIDLSSINVDDGAATSQPAAPAPPAADETRAVPEGPTTVMPQAEPTRETYASQPTGPVPVDPTMAVPIPQPVAEPTPMSGSSSSNAQGGYAAPPAAAYTPQMVPQQVTKKKAWYSSPIVAVLAGLVAFGAASSIAFRAVTGLFSSGSSYEETSPIEEIKVDIDEDDEDFSDIFEQLESTTSTTDDGATPVFQGTASDYLESHGYPTLLSFMELSGSDLASLVTSNDYFFYSEDGNSVYAKSDGSIVFNTLTDSGYLDEDDYDDLSVGGQDEGAIFILIFEGYDSPDAALEGMANCVISERKTVSDKETVAVVHGPSMREYLVDVYDVEDGDYEIDLYTPEAVEFGFFDTVNNGNFGSTPSEVVKNFNG